MAGSRLAVAFAALLAIFVGACSDGGAPSAGEVVAYTSVDQVYSEPVFRRFEEKTGIRVRSVFDTEETKSTGVLNRLIAEGANPRADLFWSGDPVRPFLLIGRGFVTPYAPSNAVGIPTTFKDAQGQWSGTAARARVLLVNRERLLQQWAEFYPRALRPRLALGRFRAETLDWWKTIDPARYGAVLGGEPAGGRITEYLRPATATFYAEKIDPRLLLDLRLRPDAGGNVEIYRRFWTFAGDDAALAPAPLVYADLMATGDGRCIETAKMIFERIVGADA